MWQFVVGWRRGRGFLPLFFSVAVSDLKLSCAFRFVGSMASPSVAANAMVAPAGFDAVMAPLRSGKASPPSLPASLARALDGSAFLAGNYDDVDTADGTCAQPQGSSNDETAAVLKPVVADPVASALAVVPAETFKDDEEVEEVFT